MSSLKDALDWRKRGYNVVPQKARDKKYPGVKWKNLQTRQATEAELMRWNLMFANGVGFITGEISGVIVIETDGLQGLTVLDEFECEHGPLPKTLTVRSGSKRGFHLHFRHPGQNVKTTANENIKIDVRGDGGFCVLPPSLHKSGGHYEIVHDAEPADLPEGLLEFIEMKAKEANGGKQNTVRATEPSAGNAFSNALGAPPAHIRELGQEPNIPPHETDRPPPPVETMRAMLEHLNEQGYFKKRLGTTKDEAGRIIGVGWVECGMALKPAYGDAGEALWGIVHRDEKACSDAPAQWASFASEVKPEHVKIATIIKAAKDAGFVLTNSKAGEAASSFVSFGSFTMDANGGLTKTAQVRKGQNVTFDVFWISAPFEVLGACRDPRGCAWGKQVRFHDADKRAHMRHVSDAALQGDPATLCAVLADEGLKINRTKQKEFAEYLSGVDVSARVTIVNRTGWHEVGGKLIFALPTETIGAGDETRVVIDAAALGPYEAWGSLDDWKLGVGALTAGHALPVFMVSAALAGPLAYLVGAGAEGGGVHVFGPSSIGKSAMLQAAASVWGRGSTPGYVRSWRATANGLEGAAASATDTCLVLDELGVGEARDVAAAIYALANGQGKARAARDGSLREPKSWRVLIISSGEVPLETKLGEDRGRKARAGQLVRLVDIPANRGLGFGAFDHAGDFDDAGKLADAIKSASVTAYGMAGPEFIRRILAHGVEELADTGKEFIRRFIERVVKPGASEQAFRAAKKFALIAFAGELAAQLGITPWGRDEARQAAIWAFERWVEKRGGTGSHEERQAIEQVRLVIEQHGEARFEWVGNHGSTEEGNVRDRLGWRKGDDAAREWYVPPEVWKAEVCKGLDPIFVARTLHKHKMLRRPDEKNLTCGVRLGGRLARVYVLTAAILDSGEVGA
jgi:uncharacterized protein (DUF927 family)